MQCEATRVRYHGNVCYYVDVIRNPKATKQCAKISRFYNTRGNGRRAHYVMHTRLWSFPSFIENGQIATSGKDTRYGLTVNHVVSF